MRVNSLLRAVVLSLAALMVGVTGARADTALPLPVRYTDPAGDWRPEQRNYHIDDFVDYMPSESGGPSFTPAVPMASGDIEWVNARELPDGRHLIEAKVTNLFVYERQYVRSGDRRWLNTATQSFSVQVGNYQTVVWPNSTGTGFATRNSFYYHEYGRAECEMPTQVNFSRVHDIVALTLPATCGKYDGGPVIDAGVKVSSNVWLQRVATVGARVASTSARNNFDSANRAVPLA